MRNGLACKHRGRGALLALAAIFLLQLSEGDAWAQGTPPKNSGTSTRVVFDFTRGVDPSLYTIIRGEDSCALKVCESSSDARREAKNRAYEEAFSRIDAMGRTYRSARRHYVDGFHRLTDNKDEAILDEDIRFLRAVEVYDHTRDQYRYVVDLGIRRLPHLFPQLDKELLRFLRDLNIKPVDGEIVFDLNEIVGRLERDPRFTEELRRLLAENSSLMRYKDDDTQRFVSTLSGGDVKIQGYDPGQYSVNSLIGAIIERSVATKVDSLLDEGYKKVTVVCEGAADALQVRSGIKYAGEGRVGDLGQRLRYGSQGGVPLSQGVRNNLDLSFARGYEGMRALAQILRPRLASGRLELFYTGKGVVTSAGGNQPESRRITFRLILGSKPQ